MNGKRTPRVFIVFGESDHETALYIGQHLRNTRGVDLTLLTFVGWQDILERRALVDLSDRDLVIQILQEGDRLIAKPPGAAFVTLDTSDPESLKIQMVLRHGGRREVIEWLGGPPLMTGTLSSDGPKPKEPILTVFDILAQWHNPLAAAIEAARVADPKQLIEWIRRILRWRRRALVMGVTSLLGVAGLAVWLTSLMMPHQQTQLTVRPVNPRAVWSSIPDDVPVREHLQSLTTADAKVRATLHEALDTAGGSNSWTKAIELHPSLRDADAEVVFPGMQPTQPTLDPSYYRALGDFLDVPELNASAQSLADAHASLYASLAGDEVAPAALESARLLLREHSNRLYSRWLQSPKNDDEQDTWLAKLARKFRDKEETEQRSGNDQPLSPEQTALYHESHRLTVAVFEDTTFKGSGILIGNDLVLTAAHVVKDLEMKRIRIALANDKVFAEKLQRHSVSAIRTWQGNGDAPIIDMALLPLERFGDERDKPLDQVNQLASKSLNLDPAKSAYRFEDVYALGSTTNGSHATPVAARSRAISLAPTVAWPTQTWLDLQQAGGDPLAHAECPDDAFFTALHRQVTWHIDRYGTVRGKLDAKSILDVMKEHYKGTGRERQLVFQQKHVFGHELWSRGGTSGAAVLSFDGGEAKLRLLGVHVSEPRDFKRSRPICLDNYKQAAVFSQVSESVRKLVETK